MDKIVILDFGSQFTQLIARRVREVGVYCEILPYNTPLERITDLLPKAVIFSGGAASVTAAAPLVCDAELFELGIPILGICYGHQFISQHFGGSVESSDKGTDGHSEFGRSEITIIADSLLFLGIDAGSPHRVWMSYGDRVTALPHGFIALAQNENSPYAVIGDEARQVYGVQFHPEVVHSSIGKHLLENFVLKIAGCIPSWTMAHFLDSEIARLREEIGSGRVICGLSGGVDSSVVAVLLHRAIGDQLNCVFVDTGLLRLGEPEQVVRMFREQFHINLVVVDAASKFFAALKGVTDPEEKRKKIGAAFIEIFDAEAAKFGDAEFLAQGTLYPDVIESIAPSGGPSVTIKSHHNVGGLPTTMRLRLVEPLRSLFKDEVRRLGRELEIPELLVGRHPFPGPGLAIRIPGEVTREKVSLLQKVDSVYLDAIRKAGLYDEIWQAFAVLLPVRSVGVMGDGRTYDYVCALRAVTSVDGMTADYYPFSHEFLGQVATRIINEVKGVNRVVYDITAKPPGTIEWE